MTRKQFLLTLLACLGLYKLPRPETKFKIRALRGLDQKAVVESLQSYKFYFGTCCINGPVGQPWKIVSPDSYATGVY